MKLRVGRQDFRVSCDAGEEELMMLAASRVAREMDEARSRYGAADGERAATMAALRVAFEAEKKKSGGVAELGAEGVKIALLSKRIRASLARTGSPQERDGT